MNFSDIKVVQFNFSLSILMFGLEKLIYLHKGKYSLYFNSLTTSVLGLSFGLGLVCTNSASAFEFDKKLVAPDGAANDFFGTPRSVSLSGNTALPEFLTKSAIAKHRSLTGSGFEQSDRRFPQPTVCCQILS